MDGGGVVDHAVVDALHHGANGGEGGEQVVGEGQDQVDPGLVQFALPGEAVLEALGHGVDGGGQFAHLVAGADRRPDVETARADAADRGHGLVDGIADGFGGGEGDADGDAQGADQQTGQDGQVAGGEEHEGGGETGVDQAEDGGDHAHGDQGGSGGSAPRPAGASGPPRRRPGWRVLPRPAETRTAGPGGREGGAAAGR